MLQDWEFNLFFPHPLESLLENHGTAYSSLHTGLERAFVQALAVQFASLTGSVRRQNSKVKFQ